MLFDSYEFILFFLPICIIAYWLLSKLNNKYILKIVILSFSLFFYLYSSLEAFWFVLLISLINYSAHYLISKNKNLNFKKLLLILVLIVDIGLLLNLKYYNFFTSNLNRFFSLSLNFKDLFIPVGISFITFQQIAFIIDSYKGDIKKQSILDYVIYIFYFPKILMGPITLPTDFFPQLKNIEKIKGENLTKGLVTFILGLAKKVLIANVFAKVCAAGFSDINLLNSTEAVLCVFAYTMQIYFDFSGYSDMAIGISKILGIDLYKNFNSPYKSISINDFWKRWHISLTTFFTKYLYIPLGGSRKGSIRTYLNVLIVFIVSGFWHGASYTFILWGLLHGIASILNKAFKNKLEEMNPVFIWIITFAFVNIAWLLFRSANLNEFFSIIKVIVSGNYGPIGFSIKEAFSIVEVNFLLEVFNLNWLLNYLPNLVIQSFLFLSIIIVLNLKNVNEIIENFKLKYRYAILIAVLFILSLISLTNETSFIYINF